LVNNLNKITQYRWMADHFVHHCEHVITNLWTFYTTVLQFHQSSHFYHKLCIIHDAFQQH
jgi:hypothetical protein